MRAIMALAAVVLSWSSVPAFAQAPAASGPNIPHAVIWADEALAGQTGAIRAGTPADATPIFTQRLTPTRFGIVTEEGATTAITAFGRRSPIPVGLRLFVVNQNGRDYGCYLDERKARGFELMECLVDTDGDGRFDKNVDAGQSNSGVVLFPNPSDWPLGRMVQTGVWAETTETTDAYDHQIGLAIIQIRDPAVLALVVRGTRAWTIVGGASQPLIFDANGRCVITMLGAELEFQRQADGAFQYTIVRGMPQQPLSLSTGQPATPVYVPMVIPR